VLAVVLSAALAFGGNYYFDWRRRRDDARERQERDARDIRPAARLVLAELVTIDQAIRHAMRVRSAWQANRQLPNSAYVEHAKVLAARLEPMDWVAILGAYDMANDLNWRVLEGMDNPLRDDEKVWFRAPWLAVRHAEQTLGCSMSRQQRQRADRPRIKRSRPGLRRNSGRKASSPILSSPIQRAPSPFRPLAVNRSHYQ
jgi:hypothetical protein